MKRLLAVLLVTLMFLAGCSSNPAPAAEAKYTAGTYTGVGAGRNGDVTVEVVFTDSEIQSVTVKEHTETEGISDPAIETIPTEIVTAQSTAVDVITGATITSNAIIEAVNDCIQQAGGTVSGPTATEATEKKEETAVTDVLVLGGGMAGMSAAMAAQDAGVDVTLIEKAAQLGGTVNVAGGYLIAVDSELYADADAPDSLDDFHNAWNQHMAYSGQESGYPDQERLDLVLSETGATIDWLASKGAVFGEEPFTGFDGGTYTCAADPNGGAGLVKELSAAIESAGIHVVLNATATTLVTDEQGQVIGAVVETKDTITTYTASAVVLATGGYANDPEMLATYAPKLAAVNTVSTAVATATGDGFKMAQEVGAVMFDEGTGFGSLFATQVEPSALALDANLAGVSLVKAIGVNANGERFASEAPSVPYMDALCSDMIQDGNAPFWYVYDSSDADAVALLEEGATAGAVMKADTLADLATAIGVDATALETTVTNYNGLAASGNDTQFNKAAENLVALEQAPYYALQIVPTTFGSTGGVKTDPDQHVLKEDGSIIPGLYAAGEMSNRYFYNENYMLGGSLGLYATCGRTAGTNAAADVK